LYYRLNVVQLRIPSLAERREDIALLAQHFSASIGQRYGKPVSGFAPGGLERLASAQWPGNVRQLQNVVEKCVVLSPGPMIALTLVNRALNQSGGSDIQPLEEAKREFEREYLTRLLKITEGNVSQAAKLAQRNRTDFYALLSRHGLEAAQFKSA
jgi:two-component system response regulator GlrR